MGDYYRIKSMQMGKMLIFIVSILLIITCLFPLFFVTINSSKTVSEYLDSKFALPGNFMLFFEKVKTMWMLGFGNYFVNTVVMVTIAISTCLVFSSLAGYAFSKLLFPKRNLIYFGIISMLAIPSQAFVIPLFVRWSRWGLTDNLISAGILLATLEFPFGIFLMRSFYHKIPGELIDSAKVDGANSFQIYYKIMLPLGMPALVSLGVIEFFYFWNELFISMIFLRRNIVRVITPAIAMLQVSSRIGGPLTDWPLLFSGILISIIIPLLVYFVFQRKLVEGLMTGALKG